MSAVALGLAAAALWGCGDFLGGLASRRARVFVVLLASQAVGTLLLVGLIVGGVAGAMPSWERLAPGLAGGVVALVALTAFYRGLAIGAMSIVAPLSATGAAVPLTVDLIRGDRPGAVALLGMGLAVVGGAIAARAPGRASRRGIGYALVAAVGFGILLTLLAEAAQDDVVWGVLSIRMTSLPLTLVVVLAARVPLRGSPPSLALAAAAGLLEIGANLAYAAGTQRGLVSVVAVLGSLYPVITVALAQGLLGERTGRLQAAGAGVALTGVALIATG